MGESKAFGADMWSPNVMVSQSVARCDYCEDDHTLMPDASQAAASAVQPVKALLRLCILLRRFLVLIDVVRLMQRGFPIECLLGLYLKLCTRSG